MAGLMHQPGSCCGCGTPPGCSGCTGIGITPPMQITDVNGTYSAPYNFTVNKFVTACLTGTAPTVTSTGGGLAIDCNCVAGSGTFLYRYYIEVINAGGGSGGTVCPILLVHRVWPMIWCTATNSFMLSDSTCEAVGSGADFAQDTTCNLSVVIGDCHPPSAPYGVEVQGNSALQATATACAPLAWSGVLIQQNICGPGVAPLLADPLSGTMVAVIQ